MHGVPGTHLHATIEEDATPMMDVDFYNRIVARYGQEKTDGFFRFFPLAGMGHCGGGEGPFAFDKDDALSQWVEHDKAPALIVAAHLSADPAAHAPDRTRPLCAYPRVAKYKGTGSIDDASNFVCMK